MPDGVLIVGKDGRFKLANAAAEAILGVPREAIVGRSCRRPGWKRFRADRTHFPTQRLPHTRVFETGRPVHGVEFSVARADGREVVVTVSGSPLRDERGDIEAVLVVFEDITKRRLAELALRESEQRYRGLVDATPDAIFVYQEGKVTFVNPAAVRLLGAAKAKQLLGKPVLDFVHPDSLEVVKGRMATIARARKPLPPMEERLVRLDGTPMWVDLSAIPFTFEGHIAVQVVARDITARKDALAALSDAEERYRLLVELSPEAIGVATDGRFTYVNPAATQLLGAASPKELLGKDVLDFVHNESKRYAKTRIAELLAGGAPRGPVEMKLMRVDGAPVDVELAATRITLEGRSSLQIVTRDVTARKAFEVALLDSEARYRLLFENSPLPMWVSDKQTQTFLAVNRAAERRYGYSSDDFLAMRVRDLCPPEDVSAFVELLQAGKDQAGMWRHITRDGTIIDVDVTSHALVFAGRPAELVVADDITDLRRAERELKTRDLAIRRAYVDVIGAVTGNRLVLMTPEELEEALGTSVFGAKAVRSYKELSATRAKIRGAIRESFADLEGVDEFMVAVCEALTNGVKHGGSATYEVFRRDHCAQVRIADQGPGIDFKNLPRATLAAGFSTKGSLGVGFTLMLDLSSRVLLSTQPGNTTLVLEIGG